jgi:hypothetical protein
MESLEVIEASVDVAEVVPQEEPLVRYPVQQDTSFRQIPSGPSGRFSIHEIGLVRDFSHSYLRSWSDSSWLHPVFRISIHTRKCFIGLRPMKGGGIL